ncbi:MAG TPA: MscL family protein [Nevskiaceae bacterium]|nr:MscL family protein [Nevskiaceae bacterium]
MTAKKVANSDAQQQAEVPLAEKSEAQLKREAKARLKHLGPLAKADVLDDVMAKQVNGFVDFLREQSVVGLAIGLVLGTQIKQVVDQFIASFVNPLIGLLLPGQGTLAEKTFTMHIGPKAGTFGWGSFVTTLISFVFVAAIVYYTFKLLKLDKLTKKKDK